MAKASAFLARVAEQITPESIQYNLRVFFPVETLVCHFNNHEREKAAFKDNGKPEVTYTVLMSLKT